VELRRHVPVRPLGWADSYGAYHVRRIVLERGRLWLLQRSPLRDGMVPERDVFRDEVRGVTVEHSLGWQPVVRGLYWGALYGFLSFIPVNGLLSAVRQPPLFGELFLALICGGMLVGALWGLLRRQNLRLHIETDRDIILFHTGDEVFARLLTAWSGPQSASAVAPDPGIEVNTPGSIGSTRQAAVRGPRQQA
jgi:hypothetical protein